MQLLLSLTLFGLLLISGLLSTAWAFAGIVIMFAFEQVLQANSEFFMARYDFVNYAFGVIVLVRVTSGLLAGKSNYRALFTPVFVSILVLHLWSALSLAWTPSFQSGFEIVRGGLPYFVLFVVLGPILVPDVASLNRALFATLLCGTPVLALAVFNPNFIYINGRLMLKLSIYAQSNPLALGELGGLMVIIGSLYLGRQGFWLLPWLRAIAVGFGFLLCFQSGSRGQLVFSILIALIMLPLARRIQNVGRLLGIFGATAVALLVALVLADRVFEIDVGARWTGRELEAGTVGRLENYLDLLRAWSKSPMYILFGLGFNAFQSVSGAGKEGYAHNVLVELLTEAGIPMLVVFMIMVFSGLAQGWSLTKRLSDDPESRASAACITGLAAFFFLIANKQGNFWGQQMLFMFLAMIACIYRNSQRDLVELDEAAVSSTERDEETHQHDRYALEKPDRL